MTNDIDDSQENVLYDWSGHERPQAEEGPPAWGTTATEAPDVVNEPLVETSVVDDEAEIDADPEAELVHDAGVEQEHVEQEHAEVVQVEEEKDESGEESEEEAPAEPAADDDADEVALVSREHASGELEIPGGYAVLEGGADGLHRSVAVAVARFNGDVTSRLLESALGELESAGVRKEAITVMVVPGAFELPLAATALAKTRRYACVVALGCVIRGDTPHFDYVAGEAASGLQLAALETGVPVSFGVLTLDRVEQADARVEKGAEAVRTALEMADVFSHLRAAAGQ